MIIVIDPARISAQSLTIWVGHGSRSHALLGDDRISFDKLLSAICEKVSKGFGAAGGVGSGWMFQSGYDFSDLTYEKIIEGAGKFGIASTIRKYIVCFFMQNVFHFVS